MTLMHLKDEPSKIASVLAGKELINLEYLINGGNNRIYKVTFKDNSCAALKCYSGLSQLGVDRLTREYKGLTFLSQNGVNVISKPIACDEQKGYALYQWIEGEKIESLISEDIDRLLAFSKCLYSLTENLQAKQLLNAKDETLSGESLKKQIKRRLERLKSSLQSNYLLNNFLENQFIPTCEEAIYWAKSNYKNHKIDFSEQINFSQRTLSPSDFGFHNALRLPDNSIVFLDFEYFGWDDPVAMMSDFLWHPAMSLTLDLKQRFVTGMCELFRKDKTFIMRFCYLYPLFGLTWVLILLNEFIPEIWHRRVQAGKATESKRLQIQEEQLLKANTYLQNVHKIMETFPYAI